MNTFSENIVCTLKYVRIEWERSMIELIMEIHQGELYAKGFNFFLFEFILNISDLLFLFEFYSHHLYQK